MTPVHTPKQVSAERLQQIVAYVDLMGPNSEPCVPGDVAQSMAAELLTRRSSAGAKDCIAAIQAERDKPIEGPEHGAWDRGRRDGLSEAMRILSALEHVNETPKTEHVEGDVYSPSHAGEDDGAVAELVHAALNVFDKLASETATVSIFDQERLGDAIKATISGRHPSPSVPPQRETSELVRASKRLKAIVEEVEGSFKHGGWRDENGTRLKDTPEWVAFYNALSDALASQTQGEGEVAAIEEIARKFAKRLGLKYVSDPDKIAVFSLTDAAAKVDAFFDSLTPSPRREVEPEALMLLHRLRDNQQQNVHDVIEGDEEMWSLGKRLSERGWLAIVSHPKGGTFHITRLGAALIASRQPTSGES